LTPHFPAAAYPCAVTSAANQDYRVGDLENLPRFGMTVESCTNICVNTVSCGGFSLKSDSARPGESRTERRRGRPCVGATLHLTHPLGTQSAPHFVL